MASPTAIRGRYGRGIRPQRQSDHQPQALHRQTHRTGLEETLKIAASGKEDYPGAKHEFEEWRGDALLSPPGTVHCLGLSLPPGGGVVSTRIAFVRVRPAR